VSTIGYRKSWVENLFIEKAELFLRILNSRWGMGARESELIDNLLAKLGVSRGSTILDLGCGNGRIAVNLALKGYRVVGVDISPVFIEDAERRARECGVSDKVSFITGNALDLDKLLSVEVDATILYWTTILGYYHDLETNLDILRKISRVTRNGGYLLILNTSSYDSIACRIGCCGALEGLSEIDDELVLYEKSELDPTRAVLRIKWVFYKKEGRDLKYLDEAVIELRLFTLHELVDLASRAGWQFIEAYHDLETLTPYTPGRSRFNVVFKKQAGERTHD